MDRKDKLIGDITCEIKKLPTNKLRQLEAYLATTFASTAARPDTLEENVTRPVDTSTVASLENSVSEEDVTSMQNIHSTVDNIDNIHSTVESSDSLEENVTSPVNTSTVASVHMNNIVSENQDNNTSTSISPHSLHQTVKLVSHLCILINA